ncbi:hypothetical protein [Rubritalea profundi]|uniref:Uncharacterized protein n=1 Tax=Rubritalea profundi TaxID=1658618 RepID=A0A2S7U0H3_9BACT|nr:hypothetical protein [Rubritalea profundi]PQJ27822.1 hypothetical protein BSZ32_04450 [Rubritalea profundi]
MTRTSIDANFSQRFFNPLFELFPISDHQRDCHGLSDFEYLQMGIERCISSAVSGNGFVQNYRKLDGKKVTVSHIFESIKSGRRLKHQRHMNQLMKIPLREHITDELSRIDELKKWHLLAGDVTIKKRPFSSLRPHPMRLLSENHPSQQQDTSLS